MQKQADRLAIGFARADAAPSYLAGITQIYGHAKPTRLSCCEQQDGACDLPLLYTPGQLRNAADLPAETYRHWRKALAPLQRARGHSPSFTPGDLVAVAIVRVLTETFGIRVGVLGSIADPLFALCNQSPWPVLERGVVVIEIANTRVSLRQEQGERLPTAAAVIVPLSPLVGGLSETLLASDLPGKQGALRFPPIAVVSQGMRS